MLLFLRCFSLQGIFVHVNNEIDVLLEKIHVSYNDVEECQTSNWFSPVPLLKLKAEIPHHLVTWSILEQLLMGSEKVEKSVLIHHSVKP